MKFTNGGNKRLSFPISRSLEARRAEGREKRFPPVERSRVSYKSVKWNFQRAGRGTNALICPRGKLSANLRETWLASARRDLAGPCRCAVAKKPSPKSTTGSWCHYHSIRPLRGRRLRSPAANYPPRACSCLVKYF